MKNHHEVGHFKNRLMIVLLSLVSILVMAGQSFAATTCSSCHGMPPIDSADGSRAPSTGAFKGGHQKHVRTANDPAACTTCHGNTSANYNSTHAATNAYMIKMNSNINTSPATGTYTKGTSFPQVSNPATGSCSNVNCHFEKNTTTRTPAPVWGDTAVDCNFCHASQPATASHTKHLTSVALGSTMICATCHPNYGTTNFSHATSAGKHPISLAGTTINNYAGVGVTNIDWLPSQQPNPNYGTCSTYCHSNGSVPGYISTKWGLPSTGCNFCHPNLQGSHSKHIGTLLTEINFYNYTATVSNGTDYKFGCANCHPFTTASHINGTVDTVLTPALAGGHLKNLNIAGATINASKKCLNVYCHSNGYVSGVFKCATSLAWTDKFDNYTASTKGRKDKCAWCHGNSPNSSPTAMPGSSAHTAHVVGIHYDDLYNGKSKKLPQGGGQAVNAAHGRDNRSTTINCNICHYATVSVNYNDRSSACVGCHNGTTAILKNPAGTVAPATNTIKHVNGKVDVAFIGQKLATKAQVANSAFAGYTGANAGGWTRNSNAMPFKTYTSSYDVTKAILSTVAGWSSGSCSNVACHANISIAWTATGVTCTNCHTRLK
jgi:predicted CxxxxCH...CXXCH cytochrome family protein